MERFFILDKFNTWYDWRLVLTAKDVTPPEPKTNYVDLDGTHGTLDLSEALSGEVVYRDRTITASFWTCEGKRKDRVLLFRQIITALHGKKIKIIEPDDPDHYFYGRIVVKAQSHSLAYSEFTIEAICEPWRYGINSIERSVEVDGSSEVDVVITNYGVKTVFPIITKDAGVRITHDNGIIDFSVSGTFSNTGIKLCQGVNILRVSGSGTVTLTYREADL